MLSIENGRALRAGNGLLIQLLLCGDVMGLGNRGCDSIGYAAKGRKGWNSMGETPLSPGPIVKPVGGDVGGEQEMEDLGEQGGD